MWNPDSHSTRATKALQKLIEIDPAMGTLSLWCKHRDAIPELQLHLVKNESNGFDIEHTEVDVAPAFTDGRTIFYGAEFSDWSLEEQVAVCAHEILHIALQHIPRAQKLAGRYGKRYSSRIFNVAADALVNETLLKANYSLPSPRVDLEEVLILAGSDYTKNDALTKSNVESLFAQLLDTFEKDGARKKQLEAMTGSLSSDLFRGEILSTEEVLQSAEWEQILSLAIQIGAASGRGIGKILTQMGDIPRTNTPWEIILRRMVTKAVTIKPKYSFGKPTNRWLALEAEALRGAQPCPGYEPAMNKSIDGQGRIVVCVDVSGSISKLTINRFAGEIDGISRRTGAKITVIFFDHGIQLVRELKGTDLKNELKALKFDSGGGTSFVEPIAEAIKHDPSIIVVLTDMLGPFGTRPGRVPVVWANCNHKNIKAPFGKTIMLKQ